MEGVIGAVTCFAANFAPKNWTTCDGQILPIATNQALFSILGTTYGGNGTTTFGLPDLRGRTAISAGQGPNLSNYILGQQAGAEGATLTINNIPSHNHNGNITLTLNGDSSEGSVARTANTYPAVLSGGAYAAAPSKTGNNNDTMAQPAYTATIGTGGGGSPVSNLSPYLTVYYVICLYGIFPSRN